MSLVVRVPQLYFWRVDFADGSHLAQFDSFGNEILIKNICGKNCLDYKGNIIEYSNYFAEYEKLHGPVVLFGFYPFDPETTANVMRKNPEIVIANSPEALPITKEIPAECYVTFKKVNTISYKAAAAMGGNDIEAWGKLAKLVIGLVHRQTNIADVYEINLTQVKA